MSGYIHLLRASVCNACSSPHANTPRCETFSAEHRYCEYPSGPVGWSYSRTDPVGTKLSEAYEFTGCRSDVLDSNALPWIVFVLRHEVEHDRQRGCTKDMRTGVMGLLMNELRANQAAWGGIRELALPYRGPRWLLAPVVSWLDSALLALFAAMVGVFGVGLSQGILWLLPCAAIGAYRFLPGPFDPEIVVWIIGITLAVLCVVLSNEFIALWIRRSR